MRQGLVPSSFSETNPAGLAAGSRWSARVKWADHRVNAHTAPHPEWVPEPLPSCIRSCLAMGWYYLRSRGSGIPSGCKYLWLAYPVVVSPAAQKRPPATGCQPCRVGLVIRKEWGNFLNARAGTHQCELDAALGTTQPLTARLPSGSIGQQ
jgi:hypothetical protein